MSGPPSSNVPAAPAAELVVLERIPREQAGVLESLFQLYAHDFSEHVPLELGMNGRFDVAVSERWWTAEDHHPFFIRANGELVGFALVRRGSRVTGATDVMDVAEFFVIRGARRRQLGTAAALALFRAFPAPWEIRVRTSNASAAKFWSRAVEAWSGASARSTPITVDGVEWSVFRVEAGGPGGQAAPGKART